MSVQGEYARAPENLTARVRLSSRSERDEWLSSLEAARVERHPDLSSAAARAREALEVIGERLERDAGDADAPDPGWMRDAHAHLLAHCRAILGDASGPAPDSV